MNKHPLTDDFRMYFNGTVIFRDNSGEIEAMYVEGTERIGDDTTLDGFNLQGQTYSADKELGYARWVATDMINYRPISGYYDLNGKGARSYYVEFVVNNRSQRKGIDPRNIRVNGAPYIPTNHALCRIFAQSQDFISNPGLRDLFTNSKKEVYWKGIKVGKMTADGFVVNEQHKQVEGLVCRLLQSI